ncbi:molybdopterin-dependent oxidoreductase [Pseudonocardia sp. WMMC193]|uniref:molybdopterin-dependent oxidoreductase n=1 Tax=Pseudonocardia sp. WMMC193 TaxID=2911965 RepID=UPI001F2529E2|nr:molybdopterin-dependent oxidoreductase [Pseudonocardia sp. WMMC193]MCF7549762.1 molybdopterin-dependent oxidoreductase [Pseudonocardia sp. WMMC193]
MTVSHSAHWGVFRAEWEGERLRVTPHPDDPDPSPVLQNIPDAVRHPARVARPAVRRGWWEHGPGPSDRRGHEEFIEVGWDEVLDRLAGELRRVHTDHGPTAVYGGSYGWASAGRFHHAQSQIHRFLSMAGGYTQSVNTYSGGAAEVLIPHVLGPFDAVTRSVVTWDQIAAHTDTVLAFGGMALKNSQIAPGGMSRHVERSAMAAASARGTRFVLVSPLRPDLPAAVSPQWLAPEPGTDAALMIGLAHTLLAEDLHDPDFLRDHCDGWEAFRDYLLGGRDADWAAEICGIPADEIRSLARRLAAGRTVITVAQSLQRAEHGEQPVWAALALAAMLGQIGLPGGGFCYGLGSLAHYGRVRTAVPVPTLARRPNPVRSFIPVARVADMLLDPGGSYAYNGSDLTYPDIRLVYWCGGNPFHHHQDLSRLRRALARVDTFVVHESVWTATARHADVVLPATTTLEREDIGAGGTDALVVAMKPVAPPYESARDDHAIFAELAARLGFAERFTEGRTPREWLVHLWERTEKALANKGFPAPTFEEFWAAGEVTLPTGPDDGGMLATLRDGGRLTTESGRVQIGSAVIASFGYDDCPGHPAWIPPSDPPSARHPLWLVSNQPATRLHSQLDFGATSAAGKVDGREVMRIHPADAAPRGIEDGAVVRLVNDRGTCLAAARVTDEIRAGVVQLPTGAWYTPAADDDPTCVHGNPNVLTRDVGSSRLAQGCTGQLTTVQVEAYVGVPPAVQAHRPPRIRQAE